MQTSLSLTRKGASRRLIAAHAPASIDAVRLSPPMIGFSRAVAAEQVELKQL
jgi:hypothetical protein